MVPLVRTLRRGLPEARLTWILGKAEARLLEGLDGIEMIEYDKRGGLKGMLALRRALAGHHFDALLQMQVAARANLLSTLIPASVKIGYDRARSKDLHGLFVSERIPARTGVHVLDAIGSFCEPLGLTQDQVEWNLPIQTSAHEWARAQWPMDQTPSLMISPCSSHVLRNWRPDRYAAVANHAVERGWRVVLCGGRSQLERATTDAIQARLRVPALDLVGRDSLPQLPALLSRADLLLTPDAGPMHIANALGVRVLGLHAASNSLRSGPYSDLRFCVDRYDDAARRFRHRPAAELPWGTKIEHAGVMDLVTVEDAIAAFERAAAVRDSHP